MSIFWRWCVPQAKLEEAREAMAWLDTDGDHQVSPQEFCEVCYTCVGGCT